MPGTLRLEYIGEHDRKVTSPGQEGIAGWLILGSGFYVSFPDTGKDIVYRSDGKMFRLVTKESESEA